MKNIALGISLLMAVMGCSSREQRVGFPEFARVSARTVNVDGDSVPICLGGYGSSMAYSPADSCFYLLTDRGPNVDGVIPESKVFPIPDFTPAIGRFRLKGDSLVLMEEIMLKDGNGKSFTGLPNIAGDGVTGELAYDIAGEVISNPSRGLDPEGLTLAPDGTFWVSDEYAPFVMQFDRTGILICELAPSRGMPAYYAKRRPNRGMEGLTISGDGKRLYGIMQSPLYLPDRSTKDVSVNNRILEIELQRGQNREFIYTMENPGNVVSEICFVNDSVMLVLERDGDFPKEGKGFKRVYKINISHATDISGREIEMLSAQEMKSLHIIPVAKELFVDIIAAIPGYSHDKPEGIAFIGGSVLCVVNDDDFGINAALDGKYISKFNAKGDLDKNIVYFIPTSQKLR